MIGDEFKLQNDIFRANVLAHMKTDNVLLDIVIGGLVMSFLNKMIEYVTKMNILYTISKYIRFRPLKKNEIIITRKEYISTSHWDAKNSYPKSILAIHNYINKNNLVNHGTMKYIDYKMKQLSDINYFIDTKVPVKMTEDIYFEMIFSEDGKTIVENNKGEKTLEHKYSLFSYKKTLKELSGFMTKIIRELDEDVIYELNKKPYYFVFDRRADDAMVFDEYSLENDRTFDNIFFDDKDGLKDRLDFFMNNREWYAKKGIPYTLGLMFSGKPGCGKTSTIKAIAKYTKRHIIDIPLNKIDSCRELMTIFHTEDINGKKIPMNKRIYLFEDIDTIIDVLKEREKEPEKSDMEKIVETIASVTTSPDNQKQTSPLPFKLQNKNDKLNLGFFLNLIDGVLETPGRILILSTNYPERLDRALVRPGRIDMKIHLERCSRQMVRDILQHYYDDYVFDDEIVQNLWEREITPAELYQFCFKFVQYKTMVETIRNEGIRAVFERIIDREEESKLHCQRKVMGGLSKKEVGTKRRRYMKQNNFSLDSSDDGERHKGNSESESD
jgi:SpoVK/Ycf46/Vps4 family AAA+-type ATPase